MNDLLMGKLLYGASAVQVGVVVYGDHNQGYIDEYRSRGFGIVFCEGYAEIWAY